MSDRTPSTDPNLSTRSSSGSFVRAWIVLLTVTLAALGTDLWSKQWAFATVTGQPVVLDRKEVLAASASPSGPGVLIPPHEPAPGINNLLEFTLVLNRGAVFGIAAGQRWVFITFTMGAVGLALYGFRRWTRPDQWLVHTAIGLVLGGGLGNLYDRLMYACVRDFLHPLPGVKMPFGLHWPGGNADLWPYVSNIADLYLMLGIAALVIHVWRTPHEQHHTEHQDPDHPDHRDEDAQHNAEADAKIGL